MAEQPTPPVERDTAGVAEDPAPDPVLPPSAAPSPELAEVVQELLRQERVAHHRDQETQPMDASDLPTKGPGNAG